MTAFPSARRSPRAADVESLAKGTELESGTVVAPGATPGTPFVLEEALERFPWGRRYRGQQDGIPVLVTVLDPVLMARKDERRTLLLALRDAQRIEQRNLLPLYGFGRVGSRDLVIEAAPTSTTLRRYVRRKMARGTRLDGRTSFAIVAHLCNALAVHHRTAAHGFVTADTVFIGDDGRVYLGSAGFGTVLGRAPGFTAADRSGMLAGVPPEQRLTPPQIGPAADIFALAAMFVEMLGCRPLRHAGERLEALGLAGPDALVACLERATAPATVARPPDIATFKAELSEAVATGPVEVVNGPRSAAKTSAPAEDERLTRLPAASDQRGVPGAAAREPAAYGEVDWPPPPQPYDPHAPQGAWPHPGAPVDPQAPLPSPPPPPSSWSSGSLPAQPGGPWPTMAGHPSSPPAPTSDSVSSTKRKSQQILAQIGHITAQIAAVTDDEVAQFTQFVDGTDEFPKQGAASETPPSTETSGGREAPPPGPPRSGTPPGGTPSPVAEPRAAASTAPVARPAPAAAEQPPLPGSERLQLARVERPAAVRPSSSTRLAPPPPAAPAAPAKSEQGFTPHVWLVLTGVAVAGWIWWAELIPG